ncbi:unnamed protein product [Amaranthus hypochondriacus]
MIEKLKTDLHAISPLPCNGKYFHVRCATHVLNLIVQEGLKVIDSSVKKVRNVVRYIDSSDPRLSSFELAIKDSDSNFRGQLMLDFRTRWNSTYSMIHRAIDGKSTISLFIIREKNSRNELKTITTEEWETVELICDFLEPFNSITNLFSGCNYPTSNLFLANIVTIEKMLTDSHIHPCLGIRTMSKPMLEKYEEYWSEHSMILSFAVILDPRFKIRFLEILYGILYCDDLFNVYSNSTPSCSSSSLIQSSTNQNSSWSSRPQRPFTLSNVFQNFNLACTSGTSELESYISLPYISHTEDIDILAYWKAQSVSFPMLSRMAKDILAIPVTSVASETSFSLGGRVLSKLRASLLPKNMEISVTTSNWMYGFEPEEKNEEYLNVLKEIAISEQINN